MKYYRRIGLGDIIFNAVIILVFVSVISLIAFGFHGIIENEENRISEGIIVDKEYHAGYYHAGRVGQHGRYRVSDNYKFLIEGEKNGQMVEYWMEVTKEDYHNYSVGDYFVK